MQMRVESATGSESCLHGVCKPKPIPLVAEPVVKQSCMVCSAR